MPISHPEYQPDQIYVAMTIIEETGNNVAAWMEIYNKMHEKKETNQHAFVLKIIQNGEAATDDDADFKTIVLTGLQNTVGN